MPPPWMEAAKINWRGGGPLILALPRTEVRVALGWSPSGKSVFAHCPVCRYDYDPSARSRMFLAIKSTAGEITVAIFMSGVFAVLAAIVGFVGTIFICQALLHGDATESSLLLAPSCRNNLRCDRVLDRTPKDHRSRAIDPGAAVIAVMPPTVAAPLKRNDLRVNWLATFSSSSCRVFPLVSLCIIAPSAHTRSLSNEFQSYPRVAFLDSDGCDKY
jgi:hypothetical protein